MFVAYVLAYSPGENGLSIDLAMTKQLLRGVNEDSVKIGFKMAMWAQVGVQQGHVAKPQKHKGDDHDQ